MEDQNKIKPEKSSKEILTKENDIEFKDKQEYAAPEKFGVQHDAEGNIIKIAENAVPPEAWKNQKKAYNDAWESNKNQALDDDI